jgi:hypothetical protein
MKVDLQAPHAFQSSSARLRVISGDASGRITTNSSPP